MYFFVEKPRGWILRGCFLMPALQRFLLAMLQSRCSIFCQVAVMQSVIDVILQRLIAGEERTLGTPWLKAAMPSKAAPMQS